MSEPKATLEQNRVAAALSRIPLILLPDRGHTRQPHTIDLERVADILEYLGPEVVAYMRRADANEERHKALKADVAALRRVLGTAGAE